MATNSQQELSDAEHGIIQIEYDAKPVKTKDGISFVKSKLTGICCCMNLAKITTNKGYFI